MSQIRKVQKSFWTEFGWEDFVLGGSPGGEFTTPVGQCQYKEDFASAVASATGGTSLMRGKAVGAKFTGASNSLKTVSGLSTGGTAETETTVPNKRRSTIQ
ncbi:MAG TPA: hypothetical protein VEI52_18145 [Terriglobales bacterium]|nr:hypothetical protein [Terriglobales bacterium]